MALSIDFSDGSLTQKTGLSEIRLAEEGMRALIKLEDAESENSPASELKTGLANLKRNLRDLPKSLIPTTWLAGLVAVLIAYSSALVLVFQAATNAGMDHAHLSSWIWALTVGSGVTAILLSLWYRQPIVIAWSIAGSALLVSSLGRYTLEQAVGAYLVSGLAVVILGVLGLFSRMLALVPPPIAMGMLAGVLLHFGTGLFVVLPQQPFLVLAMFGVFFLLRRLKSRVPVVGALVVGVLIAGLSGELRFQELSLELAVPVWITPDFNINALIGLGLPLFVLAIASQNAPGLAVMQAAGYKTPVDGPITFTGITSILTAPFGGHGLNLATIMSVICLSPDAHPDPDRRYAAGITAGVWFIVFGSFGATAALLFAGFPKALIAALAGLAMLGSILSAMTAAMVDPRERDGALLALLVTASDITLLGIGAPFWGLVIGVLTSRFLKPFRSKGKQI